MKNIIDWTINCISNKNKLIDNHDDVVNFLVKHPNFAIRLLSAYYPFTGFQLKKYGRFLHWKSSDIYVEGGDRDELPTYHPEIKGLSNNKGIIWTIELLHEYKDQINWKHISQSNRINWWSSKLLHEFINKWDWIELSSNPSLRISSKVIDEYKEYWEWDSKKIYGEHEYDGLSKNGSLAWNQAKIERFGDLLNWNDLSLNPNLKWYNYETELKQSVLEYDKSILKKFENSWNYKNLSENRSLGKLFKVLSDSTIKKLLDEKDWDWELLSNNQSLPWTEEFVIIFTNMISWKSFCSNESFNWTDEFIMRNIDNIYWPNISANRSLPWSIDLIEKYKEYWNWENLSLNAALPWSKKLLKKYSGKWDWKYLSGYTINWNKKLLSSFKNDVDWEKIIYNERLYLDIKTMNKFGSANKYKLDKYTMLEFVLTPKPAWDVKILNMYLHSKDPHNYVEGYSDDKWGIWNGLINNNNLYNRFFSKYINDSNIEEILDRIIIYWYRDNNWQKLIHDHFNDK